MDALDTVIPKQTFYKKIYGLGEFYTALYRAMRTMGAMMHNHKSKEIPEDFEVVSMIPFLPIAVVHVLISGLIGRPVIDFKED